MRAALENDDDIIVVALRARVQALEESEQKRAKVIKEAQYMPTFPTDGIGATVIRLGNLLANASAVGKRMFGRTITVSHKKALIEPKELAHDEWWPAVCRWSRSCSGVTLKEMVDIIHKELKAAWQVAHPASPTGVSLTMRIETEMSPCDEDGYRYDRYPPPVYKLETVVIELKALV